MSGEFLLMFIGFIALACIVGIAVCLIAIACQGDPRAKAFKRRQKARAKRHAATKKDIKRMAKELTERQAKARKLLDKGF